MSQAGAIVSLPGAEGGGPGEASACGRRQDWRRAWAWGSQAGDLLPDSPPWPEGICPRKPRRSPLKGRWLGSREQS